ncbi:NAD-dependent epimerase/dehydratase family protein [Glycomyces albidus]|uniref:NAD-dependent epimerase/dehydratase family protein n=1 Tax=Glycomyces albidus TaxID=2656774 RepID=A0A6L5GFY6_9ACTN|nr:NAD(P)-dependent oxidoreductase [Glycomyces albidus]MQM28619.1 NAD-dependent epimerase/dehydratase family protein [Glycomyces albidus]
MRVLLAGATGAIGSALTRGLLEAGHEVLGLTRSPGGAARLSAIGARPIPADLMDRDGLLRALDGEAADAVVHQATAIRVVPLFHRSLYATDDLREQGTANLLEAAAALGAGRFVTQSFFLGYGYRDHGPRPLTEEHPFARPTGHRPTDRHMRSMRANEEQVLAASGIALRYGMFYGPEPMTLKLLEAARKRRLPAIRGAGVVPPIHVYDAASATVAALELGRPGQAYNIADDHPVGFDEYVTTMAAVAGAPAPPSMPAGILAATPYLRALMATARIRLDTTKAKRELGWAPVFPSVREGLAAVLASDGSRGGTRGPRTADRPKASRRRPA